jgi:hypothetical protein
LLTEASRLSSCLADAFSLAVFAILFLEKSIESETKFSKRLFADPRLLELVEKRYAPERQTAAAFAAEAAAQAAAQAAVAAATAAALQAGKSGPPAALSDAEEVAKTFEEFLKVLDTSGLQTLK